MGVSEYLLVALGSALGGMARWLLSVRLAPVPLWPDLPWETIAINVGGSFVIGLVGGLPSSRLSAGTRTFLMVGVCGGYTTFSTFTWQNVSLLENGEPVTALVNMVASVILGLLATAIGITLADALTPP